MQSSKRTELLVFTPRWEMISVATSWSFWFRWLEALASRSKAWSCVQRFWAMMTPQAESITVRVAMAGF